MRYLYTTENGRANLITSIDEQTQQLHIQETYPAKEYREGYVSYLAYDSERGIHWEFERMSNAELREKAYEKEKIITYENSLITVDEANKLWLEYQAEGSEKASAISALIAQAKATIRARYSDDVVEQAPVDNGEEDMNGNEFIGADSEEGEEQFGDDILNDEEDPLLNVEIPGDDSIGEDEGLLDEIESMGNID